MTTWHVSVGFTAAAPFDEDTPFDVTEQLEEYAAVMSVSRDFDAGNIALTLEAETAPHAFAKAVEVVHAALNSTSVVNDIVDVHVQSESEFSAELAKPVYPEVVGYAEIAKMANVSRQRARQFASIPAFPHPVIETAQGPLMAKSAVEHWLESRNNRTPISA
jgi:hypothetical protein